MSETKNEKPPKILVAGIGKGGGNAINYMISKELNGVEFIAINTDAQDLERSLASTKFQIGNNLTKELGYDDTPSTNHKATLKEKKRLIERLQGYDMILIVAGMGGRMGTVVVPMIAKIAKKTGALTTTLVTYPFDFEGILRYQNAEKGIKNLHNCVDTLIIIPNQRLLPMITEPISSEKSFKHADHALYSAVKFFSDLTNSTDYMNVDFENIISIMRNKGHSLISEGSGLGLRGLIKAIQQAIAPPLNEISISGAKSILGIITTSENISVKVLDEAVCLVTEEVHEDANVSIGVVIDKHMGERAQVTIFATDFDDK